jgi:hypothetical protein
MTFPQQCSGNRRLVWKEPNHPKDRFTQLLLGDKTLGSTADGAKNKGLSVVPGGGERRLPLGTGQLGPRSLAANPYCINGAIFHFTGSYESTTPLCHRR